MKDCFLIEDDVDDQEIFCMALEAIDRTIICSFANNGYDAIEKLKSDTTFNPDCIVIDVNMPKMNGIECLKMIKKMPRLSETRIVMYSTSEDQGIIDKCKDLGANDFIVKPSSLDSLINILSKLVRP